MASLSQHAEEQYLRLQGELAEAYNVPSRSSRRMPKS